MITLSLGARRACFEGSSREGSPFFFACFTCALVVVYCTSFSLLTSIHQIFKITILSSEDNPVEVQLHIGACCTPVVVPE